MARTGPTVLPDDAPDDRSDELRAGFERLRDDLDVPGPHPPEVVAAAEEAARRPLDVVDPGASPGRWQHVDRTDVAFATLDPASSTDLDQAFAVEAAGDDVLLRYAIADVGWFVRPGDPVDAEAWRRGVTVYLPDGRAGLHPDVLAEDAASLLPDGPRPAVVLAVRVDPEGEARLDGVERALVRNRAKLAYSTVVDDDLPDAVRELSRRIERAERRRGAERIAWPEQEVVATGDGAFRLRFRPRSQPELDNAAMSLAANVAVAEAMWAAGTGLFRTMPPVDDDDVARLRRTARAFGLDWPADLPLGDFERSLDPDDPRTAAFQLAVRRAGGGASYTPYSAFAHEGGPPDGGALDGRPWHAALAATYAHATAPLRRLADRYVIEAVLAIANGRAVPDECVAAFDELPGVMARADQLANRVDRAAIDLAEAIVLRGREGEVFDAVVTDEDDRGARIQLAEPAVVARVAVRGVDPGDELRVRLTGVDVAERALAFEPVA